MALPDLDSSVGHSFGLEFDGVTIKQHHRGLRPQDGAGRHRAEAEHARRQVHRSRSCRAGWKAGEVTLTRGLTADQSFEKWIKDSQFGKMGDARKGGAIIVYDYEGNAVKRYKLTNAWPKSLEIGSLKAGDTSVLTEKLVVTYERLEVE